MNNLKFKTNVVFILFTLAILSQLPNSVAWSNSSYADDQIQFDIATDFGTHDWIANEALDALLSKDSSAWEWLQNRIEIFLVGTEAPDNSGVSMTLDGTAVTGFGDTTKHHIYLDWIDGSVLNNEDDAALRAKSCGDLADSYLVDGKKDLAAFYLGAMAHYIGDMAMYAHTVENFESYHNLNFDQHHSTIEGYVNTRSNEHDDQEEFFQVGTITIESTKPYDAAIDLAWNTYKDSSGGHDAPYMHNNYFTGWVQTNAARAGDTSAHQEYYDRVEESLNLAIEAVASAMNYIEGGSSSGDTTDDSLPGYPLAFLLGIAAISILVIGMRIKKKF